MLAFVVLFMANCNVQVEQGTAGKILGKNGFQPEIYPPSKVWLANDVWTLNPEKLILVETTTQKFVEPVKVLLKDKLTLRAAIVFRGRITSDEKRLNAIFNDMKLDDDRITTNEVYEVYGKMVILNTARAVMSKYNVDEININYERITKELYLALEPKLKHLPIDISDVTIGEIQYPDIVTSAIEKAKERRMKIETEQANVQIAITKAKGKEEVAKATYKVKMLEAKQIRDYNAMINEGVTAELLKLKQLEIDRALADKWNGVRSLTVVSGGNTPLLLQAK